MSSSTSFGSGTFGSGPLGSAPFYDTKDLIDAVLYTTGHKSPSLETTKRAAVLQFLNNSYQEIVMGRHWAWMFATWDISLNGPYDTGTIAATNGDETITGVSTVWSTNQLKGRLVIEGQASTYSVATVNSPTSLELETVWSGDDIEAGTAYKIYAVQYQLPDVVDQVRAMVIDEINLKMIPLGTQEFRIMQSRNPLMEGPPRYYTLIRRDIDDDGVYAEFYPMPDKDYNIHIDYSVRILKLDDEEDCYPIIPDRYRVVLYYGALKQFFRYLNDDQKSMAADKDYQMALRRLENDTQLTDSRLVITPQRKYRRRLRRFGPGFQDRYTFGRWD